ncbi:hypothetical protein D3C87_162850 [compost metagenome]
MKKYFYILAALSMAPTFALAQSLESDVDAELDQVYAGQTAVAAPAPAQAGINSTAPVTGGQPIYILNQATPSSTAQVQAAQPQIQKQPMTIIEASPLSESRAEQIRKARQDAELQTEQRIVEKLETSRMEDEKKRANILFGDKFNNMQEQQQQQPVVVPQPVIQPVYVQPTPVQTVTEPEVNTRDLVREEIAAAMKAEQDAAVTPVETKYVAGLLGIGDYPDTANVQGNYALGVAFGSKFDGLVIEGAFLYSQYTLNTNLSCGYNCYSNYNYYMPNNIDVNQYSGQLAAKIQLFSGVIKPVFGALASYSYRTFNWSQDNYNSGYQGNRQTANSHAIDVGALVGADLEFTPKYSLGLDFRYMWNLNSRRNTDNTFMSGPQYGTPIEKLQYYVMSLAARVNF